eukprot:2921473-Rhodomonas_salina.1
MKTSFAFGEYLLRCSQLCTMQQFFMQTRKGAALLSDALRQVREGGPWLGVGGRVHTPIAGHYEAVGTPSTNLYRAPLPRY